MKTELTSRTELESLVNNFYEKVKKDQILGPLFGNVNWESHLPVMYSFWENALFYTGGYIGNPIMIHQSFHRRHPLNKEQFTQWENLFIATVDELFIGEKAELAKQKAISISSIMQIKILKSI